MGDLRTDPSMEEILSSIKRIIAEEGDGATPPGRSARRPPRAMTTFPRDGEDEVLELSEPIAPAPAPEAVAALPEVAACPEPVAEPEPAPPPEISPMPAATTDRRPRADEPIVSESAAQATRGSLDQLSRLMIKPEPPSDGTLEGLVREMLRPVLREWIDAQLPGLVEKMVAKEIARITGSSQ